MPRFYLGVDGGQSSTTAMIADQEGRVVGVGHSGPCNHVSNDEAKEKFLRVLKECLSQAISSVGLHSDPPRFRAACLGFSGGAQDKTAYSREIVSSDYLKVTHDAEIALIGATEGKPGIIVIAGTGSIAFGRNAEGRTARAGGWGYIFGDEGGAFDLVRRALRAALQFEEGWGPATKLHERLLEKAQMQSVNQLLHRWYAENRRGAIAEFAPLVTAAAEEGDAVALEIVSEAATALTWYVQGVFRNLFREYQSIPVALVGSVFRSTSIRQAFTERVRVKVACDVISPKLSPAAGALLEALRMDGNTSALRGIPDTKT